MKPLAFNLKDAKKIAGDKHFSTFVLKDGHELKVAHAPLPALQRKQLEKLPVHLEDGGSPDAIGANSTLPTPGGMSPSQLRDQMLAQDQTGGTTSDIPGDIAMSAQDTTTPPSSSSSSGSSSTPGSGSSSTPGSGSDPANDLPDAGKPVTGPDTNTDRTPAASSPVDITQSYQQGQNAISEKEKVDEQQAAKDLKIQQDDLKARQDLNAGLQNNLKDFTSAKQNFENYVKNNPIDPNHYLESLNAGQKVVKAVGLFLGGWSSAYTHQGNPALDFLNKQIDRDIQAQGARMEQQKTILGANQDLYHDQVLANNATRVNMNDIYDHKIQTAASELGTPRAQAMADAAHSQFALQNSQLLQQMALRATAMHAVANGGGGLADPSALVPGLVPNEHQKEVFNEIKNAQLVTKNGANMLKLFDQAAQEVRPLHGGNPIYAFTDSPAIRQLKALGDPLIHDQDGRVNEFEKKDYENLLTKLGDKNSTVQSNRKAFINFMQNKLAAPTARGFGLDLSQFATTKGVPQAPQHNVGDVLYTKNGQKIQIVNAKGDYKVLGATAPTQVAGH